MELKEDSASGQYRIHETSQHAVTVNDVQYRESFIVTRDHLIPTWRPTHIKDVQPADLTWIINQSPEVLLIGAAEGTDVPPKLLRQYDCMSVEAACRTFTALSAEHRDVIAAIILRGEDHD